MNTNSTSPVRNRREQASLEEEEAKKLQPQNLKKDFKALIEEKASKEGQEEMAIGAGAGKGSEVESPNSLFSRIASNQTKERKGLGALAGDPEEGKPGKLKFQGEDPMEDSVIEDTVAEELQPHKAAATRGVGYYAAKEDDDPKANLRRAKVDETKELAEEITPVSAGQLPMGHVYLQAQTAGVASLEAAAPVRQAEMIKQIHEIVNQIVDKVYTLSSNGQTDTVITLKNLPHFEGAVLKVTAFDHASKEFNISFTNLLPEAKSMLDNSHAQSTLMQTLQERGYLVHILTVSQSPENPIASSSSESNPREQENKEGNTGGGSQRQKQQQEEEG